MREIQFNFNETFSLGTLSSYDMASGLRPPASARVQIISPERTPSLLRTTEKGRSISRRLHTPYTKTPQSRRIHGRRGRLERTPGTDPSIQRLRRLVNKTWHTYQATPLYGYNRDAAFLRKYARHLSSHLLAESQKGMGVMVEENATSRFAVFTPLPDLFPDSDVPALELAIYGSKGQATAGGNQPAWVAILCPSSPERSSQDAQDFTSMPLLLVKGAATTTHCILHWLEVQFNCCVTKLTFNPMALSWMVAMWAGSLPDKKKSGDDKKCGVELVYHLPKDITGLSKVTMTINSTDAKALWESVHDGASNEASEDEVFAFMTALEEHFHSCFKIHLAALHLKTIGTAAAYIGAEGRVKMLSLGEAHGVIQHLLELAEEQTILNV